MNIITRAKNKAVPLIFGIAWSLSCFLFVYLLQFPERALASVSDSLLLCAERLIPSLFPFMVLTELFCSLGLAERLSRLFAPAAPLLELSSVGLSAILLGAIGGFPNGAVITRRLFEKGELRRDEAERLIAFSNNSGLAFCINGIGASLYKDPQLGLKLWIIQLSSALLIALLSSRRRPPSAQAGLGTADISLGKLLRLLSSAVSNAASTSIKVCAFTVFFGVVGRVIGDILPKLPALFAVSFCELSLTAQLASELGRLGLPIVAFALGFGGLSVHSQIASILTDSGISMRKYFIVKLIQGVISALITAIIC